MVNLILIVLLVFWLLGYLQIPLLSIVLFRLFGRSITLNDILVLIVIIWLINYLPTPFREIAIIIFILWFLNIWGILAFSGLANLILLIVVIGLVVSLMRGRM